MIRCQHCHAPAQTYLCENCKIQLENMLRDLPWLLDELDARIQKLDRTGVGTIGRNRRPDEMNVMDFDAAETARKIRKTLHDWVITIAEKHTGRKPAVTQSITTPDLARWLAANTNAITRLPCAGQLYNDIRKIVGTPTDPRGGQLISAINRHQRHFAGPCPTITGHNREGEPIECGETLYADIDEDTVTCPACEQTIDVEANRLKAKIARDLLTEPKLLEVLTDLGEHVPRVTFYRWVRELRIRPKGWLNKDHGILQRNDPKRRRGDPAVYSLARARKLRTREKQHQEAKAQ